MDIRLAVGAALIGYLLGAIFMARLVGRVFAPGEDVSRQEYQVSEDDKISLDIASATNVSTRLGARFGCLVSLLDMLKVFAPTLFFKLTFPEAPYFDHRLGGSHRTQLSRLSSFSGRRRLVRGSGRSAGRRLAGHLGHNSGRDDPGNGTSPRCLCGFHALAFSPDPLVLDQDAPLVLCCLCRSDDYVFLLATIPLTRQYLRVRKRGPGSAAILL